MRLKLITFLLLIRCLSYSQSCAPGGTVLASVTGSMSLCPPPPPFVFMLAYEVCPSGFVIDTCGGNATRYYFINVGGEVTLKAFNNAYIQVKTGGKLNITGGANFIYVEEEGGAVLTGIPPGTVTTCSVIPAPNGSTCYVSGINSIGKIESSFQISPNPFSDKIIITSKLKKQFYVFNFLGATVREGLLEDEKTEINMSLQSSGIYFIKIDSSITKMVKE